MLTRLESLMKLNEPHIIQMNEDFRNRHNDINGDIDDVLNELIDEIREMFEIPIDYPITATKNGVDLGNCFTISYIEDFTVFTDDVYRWVAEFNVPSHFYAVEDVENYESIKKIIDNGFNPYQWIAFTKDIISDEYGYKKLIEIIETQFKIIRAIKRTNRKNNDEYEKEINDHVNIAYEIIGTNINIGDVINYKEKDVCFAKIKNITSKNIIVDLIDDAGLKVAKKHIGHDEFKAMVKQQISDRIKQEV